MLWQKLVRLFRKPEAPVVQIKKEVNYMEEVEKLRTLIKSLAFRIQEIPIRNGQEIIRWRVIASKGDQSVNVEKKTLQESFETLVLMLRARRHN